MKRPSNVNPFTAPKIRDEQPPPQAPQPVWDWRIAIRELDVAALHELIQDANAILKEKQSVVRDKLLARFRREASAIGLDFDEMVAKPEPQYRSPKVKGSGIEPYIALVPDAEERVVKMLKANHGTIGQKSFTFGLFAQRTPAHLDKQTTALIKRERRAAIKAVTDDLTRRGIIVVLREAVGIGTQAVYGLTEMQAAPDERDQDAAD